MKGMRQTIAIIIVSFGCSGDIILALVRKLVDILANRMAKNMRKSGQKKELLSY